MYKKFFIFLALLALGALPASALAAVVNDQATYDAEIILVDPVLDITGDINFDSSLRVIPNEPITPDATTSITYNVSGGFTLSGDGTSRPGNASANRLFYHEGYTPVMVYFNGTSADTLTITNFSSTVYGGPLCVTGNMTIDNSINLIFSSNNVVRGGGAVGGVGVSLGGSGSYTFTDNHAPGDSANSGYGGAVGAIGILLNGTGGYTFENNSARYGGALADTIATDSGTIIFSGDSLASFTGNQAAQGGAIFMRGANANQTDIHLQVGNAEFLGNKAEHNSAMTAKTGLGGAIFVDAANTSAASYQNVLLSAKDGKNLVFEGNTHNPGGTGETYNSIYFGSSAARSGDHTTTLTVDVDAASEVRMLDPMMSEHSTQGREGYVLLTLDVEKTGAGNWILGGHNQMYARGSWNIKEGGLHLVGDLDGAPAHIELRDSQDAGTGFTVASGAQLLVTPVEDKHQISAPFITLAAGSQVGLASFSHASMASDLADGERVVLKLNGDVSLINDSSLIATEGTITIHTTEYQYSNLTWSDDLSELLVTLGDGPGPGPGRRDRAATGDSATTASTAFLAMANLKGGPFAERAGKAFRMRPDEQSTGNSLAAAFIGTDKAMPGYALMRRDMLHGFTLDDSQPQFLMNADGGGSMMLGKSSLWFTPGYSHTSQSDYAGYNLKMPAWSIGYDQWFRDSFFLGLGVTASLPEYESNDADIDVKNISFALYGGVVLPHDLELGAFVAYGHSKYDQKRYYQSNTYDSDYSGNNYSLGLNLARSFQLDDNFSVRPFAAYEFMYVKANSYEEGGSGPARLNVDSHNESLHFLRLGTEGTYTSLDSGAWLTGKIYYAGLYGDNEAETSALYLDNPGMGRFASIGDGLDKNSLGLGLSAGLPLGERLEFSAGYNFLVGADSRTHQADISLLFKF